jgi:hypothetical protein
MRLQISSSTLSSKDKTGHTQIVAESIDITPERAAELVKIAQAALSLTDNEIAAKDPVTVTEQNHKTPCVGKHDTKFSDRRSINSKREASND